jgi:hypothetical protein
VPPAQRPQVPPTPRLAVDAPPLERTRSGPDPVLCPRPPHPIDPPPAPALDRLPVAAGLRVFVPSATDPLEVIVVDEPALPTAYATKDVS